MPLKILQSIRTPRPGLKPISCRKGQYFVCPKMSFVRHQIEDVLEESEADAQPTFSLAPLVGISLVTVASTVSSASE